jgi:hypothetical protein
MAINYTTLFNDIGEIVLAVESLETMMGTVETLRSDILASLNTSGATDSYNQTNLVFDRIISQLESSAKTVADLIATRLSDEATVIDELSYLPSTSIQDIIKSLVKDMQDNTETIDRSVVTVTNNGLTSTNTDAGTIVTTKKLPGNGIPPGLSFNANSYMAGVDSELPLNDTLLFTCTSDKFTGSQEGSEQFTITGLQPKIQTPFPATDMGNQISTFISPSDGNLVTFFNGFTSDTPNGWTVQAGTAATDFLEETTEVLFNASSLELVAGSTPELRLDITNSIEPGQVCCFYVYMKRAATAAGTVNLKVVANATNLVNATETVDSTYDDWAVYSTTFVVPDNLGASAYISITGAVTTANFYIASGGIKEMQQVAGIGFSILRGPEAFLKGDVFSITLANDDGGKNQRVFTRNFGYQLPSSGTPSIADPT